MSTGPRRDRCHAGSTHLVFMHQVLPGLGLGHNPLLPDVDDLVFSHVPATQRAGQRERLHTTACFSSPGSLSPRRGRFSSPGSLSPRRGRFSSPGSLSPRRGRLSSTGSLSPRRGRLSSPGSLSPQRGCLSSTGSLSPRRGRFSSTGSLSPLRRRSSTGSLSPRRSRLSSTGSPSSSPGSRPDPHSPVQVTENDPLPDVYDSLGDLRPTGLGHLQRQRAITRRPRVRCAA